MNNWFAGDAGAKAALKRSRGKGWRGRGKIERAGTRAVGKSGVRGREGIRARSGGLGAAAMGDVASDSHERSVAQVREPVR